MDANSDHQGLANQNVQFIQIPSTSNVQANINNRPMILQLSNGQALQIQGHMPTTSNIPVQVIQFDQNSLSLIGQQMQGLQTITLPNDANQHIIFQQGNSVAHSSKMAPSNEIIIDGTRYIIDDGQNMSRPGSALNNGSNHEYAIMQMPNNSNFTHVVQQSNLSQSSNSNQPQIFMLQVGGSEPAGTAELHTISNSSEYTSRIMKGE